MPTRRELTASRSLITAPAEPRSPGGAGRRSGPCTDEPGGARRLAQPLLCIALLSPAACGDGPVFTKLFASEHFEYYVEEGATPPCDGTDQWLERYYNANAKFLGATLPPGEKIEYYLAGSAETLGQLGCSEGMSCADGTTVRSILPVFPHEIVHANASLVGDPPALFTEGLAVVIGCTNTLDDEGPLDTSEPIELLVETVAFNAFREANGLGVYVASASFVRYLIDRFGSRRFLSFYAHAPKLASRQGIEAVFQVEMGETLADALSDWRARPPLYYGDLCLRLMECDPSMPSLTDADATLACSHWVGASFREALLRFEVPTDRMLHVTMDPVPAEPYSPPGVSFFRCTGGDAIGLSVSAAGIRGGADRNFHLDPTEPGSAVALDVPPGEYMAWFQAPGEARIHVDVEERRSPMRNTACQPAEEPLALSDTHPTTLATRWIERPCQGPWCPGQSWDVSIGTTGGALEARVIAIGDESNFSPGELYICSEPCPEDTSNCELLTLEPDGSRAVRSAQTFEPGAVLHLGAPAAPFPDRFAVWLRVAPE